MSGGLKSVGASVLGRSREAWLTLLEAVVAGIGVWLHFRMLSKVPLGFSTDEVSIAYNAHLIASTGHDEFGVAWPMYTRSVNDYKNPVLIYLAVLVMRVLDLSAWTVRLPSALCWLVGSGLFYWLARRLSWSAEARIVLLLSVIFTPSLFCLSRISFEVIALYPVLAFWLLALQRGFEGNSLPWAALAGFSIGLSTYVYTTFRLLAPLHCVLVAVCYWRREYWRRLAVFATAAVGAVVPFAWYMRVHPEHLTSRYEQVGFLHLPMPALEKLKTFAGHYLTYFELDYLLLHGDPNRRHDTGYGGVLLFPTVVGLALGVAAFVLDKSVRESRFNRILLGGVFLAPVAGALTNDIHHSLRGFSLVIFAMPFAVIGFQWALRDYSRRLLMAVAAVTALCGVLFVADYFGPYVVTSIGAFEHYGFREAIGKAVRQQATRIVIDDRRKSRHADLHANFWTYLLSKGKHPSSTPLVAGAPWEVRPGEFFVFEDPKNKFPDLHQDLPEHSVYVVAPYGRRVAPPRKQHQK